MVEKRGEGGYGGGMEVEEAGTEDGAEDGMELGEELGFIVGVFLVGADWKR